MFRLGGVRRQFVYRLAKPTESFYGLGDSHAHALAALSRATIRRSTPNRVRVYLSVSTHLPFLPLYLFLTAASSGTPGVRLGRQRLLRQTGSAATARLWYHRQAVARGCRGGRDWRGHCAARLVVHDYRPSPYSEETAGRVP